MPCISVQNAVRFVFQPGRHIAHGAVQRWVGAMTKKQIRELIVRAIEDAIILFLLFVGVWSIAYIISHCFELLSVL